MLTGICFVIFFFFSSRRRHTRCSRDWSSDVCSSDLDGRPVLERLKAMARGSLARATASDHLWLVLADGVARAGTREALLATVDSVGVSARRLDLTAAVGAATRLRSEEHTSELQSRLHLVCRLLLEKKKKI